MFRRSTSTYAFVRPLLAAVAAGATAMALAPFAQASNVVFRNHIVEQESHIEQEEHGDDFCDVPFLVLFEGRLSLTEFAITKGNGDLEYFSFHVSTRETFTNMETGASFRVITTFSGRDQKLTLNDDGTLSVQAMDRFSTKLFGSDGKLVGIDAGLAKISLVVDLGDPEDPEDDQIISETVTDHGTRTFGDRDFCEDVMTFLG